MEGEAEADGDCFTPLTPGCENDVGGRFILGGWAAVLETAVAMVWGERAGGGEGRGEKGTELVVTTIAQRAARRWRPNRSRSQGS